MQSSRQIHLVKVEKLDNNYGYRFCFTLSLNYVEGIDGFNYDITDNNSFYIDVAYPTKNSFSGNILDIPEKVKAMVYDKLMSFKRTNSIDYSSIIPEDFIEDSYIKDVYNGEPIDLPNNIFIHHRYWHMQLHPNDFYWNGEKELISQKGLIGVSENIDNKRVLDYFIDEMQIGDVVLIRHGSTPIALVMILGEAIYEKPKLPTGLDWFEWRRKVKFLTWCNDNQVGLLYPRGILKRSVDNETFTYKYIDDTYKEYVGYFYTKDIMFLRSIEIDNYKRFNNFKIDFTYNDTTLPIIVLAGINGSGKTSLLELIKELFTEPRRLIKYGIIAKLESSNSSITEIDLKREDYSSFLQGSNEHVVYIKAGIDDIYNTNFLINQYINNKINNEDRRLSEANTLLKKLIDEALSDLDISFHFSCLKDGKIFFENNEGKLFDFESLSTGERTLITKIITLHLQANSLYGKIVLIDEPEISLHPSWQSKIFRIYESVANICKCQVFIATHSPHIISSTPSKSLRILKEEEGKIVCYTSDYSYGQDFSNILLGVMGVEGTRDSATTEKLNLLAKLLKEKGSNSNEFIDLYSKLKKQLGDYDQSLNLIGLEAEVLKNNGNNQKD